MRNLKRINSASEIAAQDYDVVYFAETEDKVYVKPTVQWTLDGTRYIVDTDGNFHEYFYDPKQRSGEPEDNPRMTAVLDGDTRLLFRNPEYDDVIDGIQWYCYGLENPEAHVFMAYLTTKNTNGTYTNETIKGRVVESETHQIIDSMEFTFDSMTIEGLSTITDGATKMGNELPFDYEWKGAVIEEDGKKYKKEMKIYTLPNNTKETSTLYRKGDEIQDTIVTYVDGSTKQFKLTEIHAVSPKYPIEPTNQIDDVETAENIVFKDVVTIGKYSFYNCSKLLSVTIPNTIQSIDNDAFNECDLLGNIYFQGTEAEWRALGFNQEWDDDTRDIPTMVHTSDGKTIKWVLYEYVEE